MKSEFSPREEIANSATHGFGLLLSVIGMVVLISGSIPTGDPYQIVSCSIFGASLILLYSASTLYHTIPNQKAKRVLRLIDHTSIYLLIAGTNTPIMLVNLRGPWGWSMFGIIWGIAFIGIYFQFSHLHRMEIVRVALYVLMGWVIVFAIKPLYESIEIGGFVLIIAGGLAYTGGVAFYVWNKLPYNHAIWHLFVMTGSACHFFAVLLYLKPNGA